MPALDRDRATIQVRKLRLELSVGVRLQKSRVRPISREHLDSVAGCANGPDLVADLTHWHHDTFLITWRKPFPWWGEGWAQFLMDNRGRVTELKLDVPNEDFWFHELELRKR